MSVLLGWGVAARGQRRILCLPSPMPLGIFCQGRKGDAVDAEPSHVWLSAIG